MASFTVGGGMQGKPPSKVSYNYIFFLAKKKFMMNSTAILPAMFFVNGGWGTIDSLSLSFLREHSPPPPHLKTS